MTTKYDYSDHEPQSAEVNAAALAKLKAEVERAKSTLELAEALSSTSPERIRLLGTVAEGERVLALPDSQAYTLWLDRVSIIHMLEQAVLAVERRTAEVANFGVTG